MVISVASAIIHMCVAKKVNEKLKMNERELMLGTIAPDISKQVGETKYKSHFLKEEREDSTPDIKEFLNLYKQELNKPFEMGYFIHLLTDKYWFSDYIYSYLKPYAQIHYGRNVDYTFLKNIIYNDYTNINIDLIDHYNLSLAIFYEDFSYPDSKIKEIPIDRLDLIVEKMGIIVANSQTKKNIIFNLNKIINFINEVSNKIIDLIEKYDLIELKGETYGQKK